MSPLSLWVHHTPGWSRLATMPDASVSSADVTAPRFTVEASAPPHAAARRSIGARHGRRRQLRRALTDRVAASDAVEAHAVIGPAASTRAMNAEPTTVRPLVVAIAMAAESRAMSPSRLAGTASRMAAAAPSTSVACPRRSRLA